MVYACPFTMKWIQKKALVSENFDIAIMVGMLLALMQYNIILFVSSRKKENIFYALY